MSNALRACYRQVQSYCGVSHLAMTLWPSHSWQELLLAMFTVCFDSSGQEKEHDYVVVAGFVSSAKEWIFFTDKWKKRLYEDGLDCFRGSDCQNWEGDFRTWKYQYNRRIALWCDLLDLIESSAFRKFVCGVDIKDYNAKVSPETKRRMKINAYALCAMQCADNVRKWARQEGITTPLEYVFEEGDIGRGMLIDQMVDRGFPHPAFRPKKDTVRNGISIQGFVPLQAADFLANECFVVKKIFSRKRRLALTRPIYRFRDMPGKLDVFLESGLARMDRQVKKSIPVKIKGIWRPSTL